MSNRSGDNRRPFGPDTTIIIGALIAIGLVVSVDAIIQVFASTSSGPLGVETTQVVTIPTPSVKAATIPAERVKTSSSTPSSTSTVTPTPSGTPTPTDTSTPTVTPTPTLNLARCNAAGCGLEAKTLPTIEYDYDILLTYETPIHRLCEACPPNKQLSETEINNLIGADRATLSRLRAIALSQEAFEIAPGIVYIVFNKVHHVVIDLNESGYILRNIIPDAERGTLITPSYCLSPNSLVVIDADYHGLNGSNKTETGQDLFFHLGRATLFQRDGRFDIDVIGKREDYDPTTISWGGGPIFIWDGQYDYNPKQEWFDEASLDYYRDTRWAKVTAALSRDRKYLFLTASYGLTLKDHAENIIDLGQKWGIEIDRAMRFDGGESAYLAIRLGDYVVPVLNIDEPLIVNCLAVEQMK